MPEIILNLHQIRFLIEIYHKIITRGCNELSFKENVWTIKKWHFRRILPIIALLKNVTKMLSHKFIFLRFYKAYQRI